MTVDKVHTQRRGEWGCLVYANVKRKGKICNSLVRWEGLFQNLEFGIVLHILWITPKSKEQDTKKSTPVGEGQFVGWEYHQIMRTFSMKLVPSYQITLLAM